MGNLGTFDLPVETFQSTSGARRAYTAMYSRTWPHDDAYLRVLAERAWHFPGDDGRCATLLNAMRENDTDGVA